MKKQQKPLTDEQKKQIICDAYYSNDDYLTFNETLYCHVLEHPKKGDSAILKKCLAAQIKRLRAAIRVIEGDGY